MSDVLSQEEIDALLEGVKNGDVAVGHHISDPDAEITEFDLHAKEKISRGRLPSLEMINERFARRFGVSIYDIVRQEVDLSIGELRMEKFGDYIQSLNAPSNINTVNVPRLDSTALIVFSRALVDWLVDLYFGGSAKPPAGEPRLEFTATELRVVHRLLELAFADLNKAWEPVASLEFTYTGSESNPRFANFFSPSEIVLVSEFRIVAGEDDFGQVDIMLPFSALEPFREALDSGLQSDQAQKHQLWKKALSKRLETARVELRSELASARLNLRDLSRLREGDIIPVEMAPELLVKAKDTPVFTGVFGTHKGSNAIRVVAPVSKNPTEAIAHE